MLQCPCPSTSSICGVNRMWRRECCRNRGKKRQKVKVSSASSWFGSKTLRSNQQTQIECDQTTTTHSAMFRFPFIFFFFVDDVVFGFADTHTKRERRTSNEFFAPQRRSEDATQFGWHIHLRLRPIEYPFLLVLPRWCQPDNYIQIFRSETFVSSCKLHVYIT